MESKPTLDQRRAVHAWNAIKTLSQTLSQNQKESYGREAKKLPVRILNSGLAGSLAFLNAKGQAKGGETKGHKRLIEDLNDWILRERKLNGAGEEDLLACIVKGNSLYLRRATEEALAYLQWLVRFAEAEGLAVDDQAQ